MPSSDANRLHSALLTLRDRALGDHRLAAEFHRARREFFGVDSHVAVRPTAELRFLEWFLLEQESLALAAVPIDVLKRSGDDDSLESSAVGVYRIEALSEDRAEARDLQDDEVVEIVVPTDVVEPGDLVVGRIYPASRGTWQPSPAIAIYRPGHAIGEAFRRDVGRLELERRLSQIEIEKLLLQQATHNREMAPMSDARGPLPAAGTASHRQVERIEAELETVLAQGGAPGLTTQISDSLAQSERMGAVTGPLLEQLAFETKVDLDRVRRLLLELWHAHHADEAPPATSTTTAPLPAEEATGETLGQRLARVLDEGLSQKRDVEDLFRQLEEMAGIDGEEDDEDDALVDAGRAILDAAEGVDADAGDFAPLVTEYLWETQKSGTAAEATLQMWVGLQQNAAIPHVNLDDITAQDLMRLLLHCYLRAEPRARAAAVRSAYTEVELFSQWAEATQEMSIGEALRGSRGALIEHLDRLQDLGVALSTVPHKGATAPGLLRVEDTGADGFGVRGDEGGHWILTDKSAAQLVRQGDLLLASLVAKGNGHALSGPVVALPPDAESLIG